MADRNESIGVSLALKIGDFIKGLGDARSATQDAAKGMGTALETETTSRLNQLKDRLSGLKNEKPKIEVDTTAVNAVTGRIGELKKQLAELSEKKVSLGDVASIQASEEAIRTAEKEIQRLGTTLSGLGPQGQKAFEQLKLGAKETEGPLSSLKSVTLGMFAAGGMIGAAREFGEVLKGVFESGKEALQDEEKLTVAFKGNGQAAKEASENADKLAIKYNIMPGILKEISANAAIVGGATGKFNEDVTELAAGFTKLNVPGLSATAVVRAFTKGAGDPEGAAGLGRLTQSFPQLAGALAGITDPAEKARKAMEIMGPQFQMLQAQAGDSANASERMGVAMKVFQESVGKVLYGALASSVIPALSLLVQGLTKVSQAVDSVGPVIRTLLGIIAGLTLALIVATAVEKAHILAKIESFAITAKKIVQDTIDMAQTIARTAITIASTVATWAGVAATAALTAAMWLLTSPVGLLILAIAGVGIAIYEAYEHIEPFRKAVDAVGSAIAKAAAFVWKFKEYFLLLLGPVGMAIGALMLLYQKVEFVHKAFDAIGGFFTKLFGGGPKEGADAVKAVQETFDKTLDARRKADADALAQQQAALTTKLADIKANEAAGVITKTQADAQKAAAQKQYDDAAKKANEDLNGFLKGKHEEQTKAIQAEYDKQKAALVQTYKEGKVSAQDFNAEMSKLDASLKSQQAAVEKTGDAWADAKKKYDAYAARIAGKTDEETKDVKQEIDNTTAIIAANLDKLGMTAAQFLAAQKSGFKGMTETQRAAAIEVGNNIQHAQDELKRLREQESAQEQAKILNKTADDPNAAKTKATKDAKDTYAQILSAKITHEKEMYDLDKQSGQITLANLKSLQSESQKMRAEDMHLNDSERKQAMNLMDAATQARYADAKSARERSLIEQEQYHKAQETALFKAQDEIKKAVESQIKTNEELRKSAETKELTAYETKKAAIADAELKSLDIQSKALAKGAINETQYAENIAAIHAKSTKDYLAAEKAFYDEKLKTQIESLTKEIEAEKKGADEKAKVATEQAGDDPLKKWQAELSQKLANLNIEHEQAVKAAILKGEVTTKIDQDYQDQKTALEDKAAKDRMKIVEDQLKKENILYAGAMDDLKTLFSEATKAMISAVNQFFGFEKAGANAMSANDQKLAELDKNKKIAALQAEVRANNISYEEYTLQRTKLDEEFAKKQKDNSQSVSDFLKKAEESVVDSVVSAIAKKAEAWVADQITRLALSLIYKTTDAAASTAQAAATAAAWAPAAALAATASFGGAAVAGGIALDATALDAQVIAKSAEGEFITGPGGPKEDNHLRRVSAGETIVDAATTKRLGGKDFLGNAKKAASLDDLFKSAMPEKTFRVYSALQQDRGIVPPISPALSSSVIGGGVSADHIAKLVKTMDKLHAVASDLHKNGVDAYIGESHFQDKIRKSGKSVEAAKRLRDKQVLRRSGVSGGGMH